MLNKAVCGIGQGVQMKSWWRLTGAGREPCAWGTNDKLRLLSALLLTAPETQAEWHKQARLESLRELLWQLT